MSNWETKHSPYTPEGGIESSAKFGRSRRSRSQQRQLRRFGIVLVLSPIVLFVIAVIASALSR